jgi:hypothetical protein
MDTKPMTLSSPLYELGFYSIPLPPSLLSVPEKILAFVEKAEFDQKKEIHLTLISQKALDQTGGIGFIEEINDVIGDITEWEITPLNKFYLMAKKGSDGSIKESVIQMVEFPAMEEFYSLLRRDKIIAQDSPTPPSHITLFTKFDDNGISINSQDDFDDYLIRQIY